MGKKYMLGLAQSFSQYETIRHFVVMIFHCIFSNPAKDELDIKSPKQPKISANSLNFFKKSNSSCFLLKLFILIPVRYLCS